jgi:ribosome-binding protein aMBF1 (putative translation factor)
MGELPPDLQALVDDAVRRANLEAAVVVRLTIKTLEHLSELVAREHGRRGLSFRQLAEESGVNVSTLHKFENGGMIRVDIALELLDWYAGSITR